MCVRQGSGGVFGGMGRTESRGVSIASTLGTVTEAACCFHWKSNVESESLSMTGLNDLTDLETSFLLPLFISLIHPPLSLDSLV